MDLSAVIFVLLAIAWAVYLIPKSLKHHDEVARTRSIDEFSSTMRVVAHREPVGNRDTRLVVPPAASGPAPAAAKPSAVAPVPAARAAARRKAARVAARRRRRILTLLLLSTIGTSVAAYLAYVPWWAVAIPGGLTVAFLVLCRTQVKHEAALPVVVDVAVVEQSPEPLEQQHPVDEQRVTDFDDTEDTVDVPVAMLQAAAAATSLPTADGSSLWDPLPVTLPTYVTKPKAKRTVRTIDLTEPGTWTSGRTTEDALIAAQAAEAKAATDATTAADEAPKQRAVGS